MSDQVQLSGTISSPLQMRGIETPHEHDVLSGRGNFVNYHAGNEHFRALVRKHKMAYVACPKPQKGKFSRLIVDEIRNRDPPGRFLKQDPVTKLWHDIGDKKALDKTRQALREGAPELLRGMQNSDDETDDPRTSKPIPSGKRGKAVADIDNGKHAFPGVIGSMPPPAVIPSAAAVALSGIAMQDRMTHGANNGRVVPGMIRLSGTPEAAVLDQIPSASSKEFAVPATTSASQPSDTMIKQFASMFPADQLEPTPINPNVQMKVTSGTESESSKASSSLGVDRGVERGLERADSLKFESLFSKDQGSAGNARGKSMHGSSQHMSAMTFSFGDMTDDSNLSAVFEDSMRISDDALPSGLAKGRKSAQSPSLVDERKRMNMSGQFDMSITTFSESSAGLGNSMNMSVRGFEVDPEKIDKV